MATPCHLLAYTDGRPKEYQRRSKGGVLDEYLWVELPAHRRDCFRVLGTFGCKDNEKYLMRHKNVEKNDRVRAKNTEEHRVDGASFPAVFTAQCCRHTVVLQLLLYPLAPFRVSWVVADEGEIFELLLSVHNVMSGVLFFGSNLPTKIRKIHQFASFL